MKNIIFCARNTVSNILEIYLLHLSELLTSSNVFFHGNYHFYSHEAFPRIVTLNVSMTMDLQSYAWRLEDMTPHAL